MPDGKPEDFINSLETSIYEFALANKDVVLMRDHYVDLLKRNNLNTKKLKAFYVANCLNQLWSPSTEGLSGKDAQG